MNSEQSLGSMIDSIMGDEYLGLDQITTVHGFNKYQNMCRSVLSTNNISYEIFKIISQSKVSKIKHLVIEDDCPYNSREQLIDENFKLIRRNALNNADTYKEHRDQFEVCSDDSSSDA